MQHAHCFSRIGDQQNVSWLAKLNQVTLRTVPGP